MRRFMDMRSAVMIAAFAAGLGITSCSDDDDDNPIDPGGPDLDRSYVQIERLGNPLVSEVTLEKREHGHHNAVGPASDAVFVPQLEEFVMTVGGRSSNVATTLSTVLLPDELVVDTSKDGATAGWLTWALAAGWGGRKLTDDVVDGGLNAIFGDTIESTNVTPGLTTDNVDLNDADFQTTFPYLAEAH
jgi:hypothetical protein